MVARHSYPSELSDQNHGGVAPNSGDGFKRDPLCFLMG